MKRCDLFLPRAASLAGSLAVSLGLAGMIGAGSAAAQTPAGTSGTAAASLRPAISLPHAITNGVAISTSGRTFLVIQKQKNQDALMQVAEYVHGELKPFPDTSWNTWKPGAEAAHAFVHANSIRFGPDGTLWVVDFGSPSMGQPIVVHGPKLVGIDIGTGRVVKIYGLDHETKPQSAVDDVRFNGDHAYLTDAGWPGLIVVHLPDGSTYRAMTDQPSTTALKPLYAEGRELQGKDGKPVFFHADQLEVSPDGATLYYQPCSGPMYALPTADLDDQSVPDAERSKHVRVFANTGTAGGTAIDAKGNVYVSDTQHDAVLKVTSAGMVTTLVQDPRLVWVDAMWITADGRLWMPAAQIDRTPSFDDGQSEAHYPMTVFTVKIGSGPSPIDHR